jgi:hypothetical protein
MGKTITGSKATLKVGGTTIASYSKTLNVKILLNGRLPDLAVKTGFKKEFLQYNVRTKFVTDKNGITEGEYRRVAAIFRKPSKTLDMVEFLDKGVGITSKTQSDLVLEGNTQQFIEKLITQAIDQFVHVTHVARISKEGDLEQWAAFDADTTYRVKNRYGETLQFGIAPVVTYRITGNGLVKAKKMIAKLKGNATRMAKRALKNGESIIRTGKGIKNVKG